MVGVGLQVVVSNLNVVVACCSPFALRYGEDPMMEQSRVTEDGSATALSHEMPCC